MKTAIVGFGVQGRKRRAVAGKQVVAIVDPVAPGADFKSLEEVALERYDAACVCLPDQAKLPVLRYLLAHGKHVLVEKPLRAAPEEIRELMALSKTNHAACYSAYNHRFEPHIARLRQILDAGT